MNALKEWSVVCQRLAEGTQILLLRKGGIQEVREGFQVEHKDFLLYPTRFHQRDEELIPSAQEELQTLPPPEKTVKLELYAEVGEATFVSSLETALKLESKHCLTPAAVEKRFNYGKKPGLWAITLRVFQLLEPIEVEETEQIRGCKSWVELPESEFMTDRPVLSLAEFDRQADPIRAVLAG